MASVKPIYVNVDGDFVEVIPTADYLLAKGLTNGTTTLDVNTIKDKLDRIAWSDLVASWTTEPILNAAITGGEVYTYVYGATTYYRFVPTPYTSAQDQFFSGFDGTNLTGLVATRGASI